MTRTEFLEELREGLSGEVNSRVVQESVAYYSRYISEAVAEGKTEEQVLDELGPVRLIVKSIIDADRGAGRKEEPLETEYSVKQNSGFSFRSWYGRLILILLAVLIVVVVIALVIGVVMAAWYLLPVVVVLGIVIILAKIFLGRRQ